MSALLEIIGRGWDNVLARPSGPLNLRFLVQPTIAGLLALRAGFQDAREGRQGYLWAMLTRPERRSQLVHDGWRGARTPFLIAIALDGVYQLMTVRFIYPLELLFTATLLALVPYALLRGPFNRLARLFVPLLGRLRGRRPQENQLRSLRKRIREEQRMSSDSKTQDWSKPAAMAIPKGGYFQDKVEQGRYGPIFPKTPACYGFSILAKIIPGREDVFYKYAKDIETTIAAQPDALAVCNCTICAGCSFPSRGTPISCIRESSTPTSTSTPKTR